MGRQLNVLCGSKPQSRLHYMTATLFHCCGPKPPGYRLMHRSIRSASTRPQQLLAQDASGCGPKRNGSRQSTRLRREVAGFEARPAARAAGSSIHPVRHTHDRSFHINLERIDMSIDVRREAGAPVSEARLSTTWEVDLDYVSIARFASLAVERSLSHSAAR